MSNAKFAHLSDQDLLLTLDGELPRREVRRVEVHLSACWTCRARKQALEATIAEFVSAHHRTLGEQIPPGDGPRALLRVRLQHLPTAQPTSVPSSLQTWAALRFSWPLPATAAIVLALITILLPSLTNSGIVRAVTMPDPRLTPGATIAVPSSQVCAADNVKNREVPAPLKRRVFEKYGIKGAPTQSYEVDYLITPALGGAEDVHNLWPQSYKSTVWNAFIKDQLEDYLRDRVCMGQMDLTTAQNEIAGDWIAAYKKYFHTDQPLKDIPE